MNNMKKKIGDLTLKEILYNTRVRCEDDTEQQSCDNCPLYILKVSDCIETKCKLMLYNLDYEIEVEEND